MFDRENWAEIFSTIKENKMRTFLTGFAVSWGIFMFCILLCAGNGLRNGMTGNFGNRSTNVLGFNGWETSMPYKGLSDNRDVLLDENDMELVKQLPEVDIVAPRVYASAATVYGQFTSTVQFTGVIPEDRKISGLSILGSRGRWLNELDLKDKRKVAVINEQMQTVLFQGEDPVGKQFLADNLCYTVIGVYKEDSWGNSERAYIPFTTAQLLHPNVDHERVQNISVTLKHIDTKEKGEAFDQKLRNLLARRHHFDPADTRALNIWNRLTDYLQFLGIFNGISAFIWMIGIGTLIAGVIGTSNIMLITVRERTREIGIRKALGAKPKSILMSILLESVFIISVFGYVGMFLGIAVGELAASILAKPEMEQASHMFANPTIDLKVAFAAMLVLIVSGLVAGFFPAYNAVKISPVEAMKE
ncbi:MAG: ABC transporter permease [Candidatus Symbiothrix sp.]|jgi:putative ABC transport system permease protein|nr:ABC transporter permease [Candidatus Symbiothrix sp.]